MLPADGAQPLKGLESGFKSVLGHHIPKDLRNLNNLACPITVPILRSSTSAIHDGFGDASFLGKYRLLAGNEEHRSYILTMFLAATSDPTGSYSNGARGGVIAPTIAGARAG
jgi:hypothetical protein